jgi:hypothetical protein
VSVDGDQVAGVEFGVAPLPEPVPFCPAPLWQFPWPRPASSAASSSGVSLASWAASSLDLGVAEADGLWVASELGEAAGLSVPVLGVGDAADASRGPKATAPNAAAPVMAADIAAAVSASLVRFKLLVSLDGWWTYPQSGKQF